MSRSNHGDISGAESIEKALADIGAVPDELRRLIKLIGKIDLPSWEPIQVSKKAISESHGPVAAAAFASRFAGGPSIEIRTENIRQVLEQLLRHCQSVPVSIWVSDDDGSDIRDSLYNLLQEHKLEFLPNEEPVIRGSWLQRITLTITNAKEGHSIREVQNGVESLHSGGGEAACACCISPAATQTLLEMVSSHNNAVLILGQLIVVKYKDTLTVKTIDAETAALIERSPILPTDPEAMLRVLSGERLEEQTAPGSSPGKQEGVC
jgi:hypothetical protein